MSEAITKVLQAAEVGLANLVSYQSSANTPSIHEFGQARRALDGVRAALSQPAPLAGEVTDEKIIAIKKASKAEDPTKPWGDTLAFARAILALRPQAVPMTPEQMRAILTEAGYDDANVQARADFINGARYAERHHGITAKAEGGA